ncbi:unnamed protein product [Pleuronectes platessa]|uniref:Uncharacterized protein n=1 Tax=Pleuronectes platessa TaxID=8262 RepID=A0A9N7TK40_PLEPL|nr:unnamed protein product [Pleuronectes platessa]
MALQDLEKVSSWFGWMRRAPPLLILDVPSFPSLSSLAFVILTHKGFRGGMLMGTWQRRGARHFHLKRGNHQATAEPIVRWWRGSGGNLQAGGVNLLMRLTPRSSHCLSCGEAVNRASF